MSFKMAPFFYPSRSARKTSNSGPIGQVRGLQHRTLLPAAFLAITQPCLSVVTYFKILRRSRPGNYTLTFYVENQSPNEAKLVLAVQQFLGIPISELFAAGTAEELSLPASMTGFVKETFNFTITPSETFIPQELYFSNSYDAPIPPITNSINPPGTIIDIADVSLIPTPSMWARGISGDFATASNWNPAVVPGPADDAIIGAKGTYTVTSSVNETVNSLTIANKHVTLLIDGGSTFSDVFGGVNDGTVVVDGSTMVVGTNTTNTTLSNVGTIDLNDNSLLKIGFGAAASATDLLNGGGHINLSGGEIGGFDEATVVSDNTISGTAL